MLQPGGVAVLCRLDLKSCLEGIDFVPVAGYRIFYHGDVITFLYPPISDSSKNADKPRDMKGEASTMADLSRN
ncbi:hypothetical protein F4821DRAFT_170104 [Hypoxylon rubiginosum]|uniref:Uncharacterized protein n=1 Tax=Hypoxylon rubiginosum TaxID=110542 RepID=A0ACC0CVQ8_9PEZI|nr:hypothetical protein F4821DRAFT_170104 [Hypoxylon rubiginosum]